MKTFNFLPTLAAGVTTALAVGLAAPMPEAQAANIWTYDLGSHPDGSIASPFYGVRFDGLMDGGARNTDKYTFDFDHALSDMELAYNMDAKTITISGSSYGGADDGDGYKAGTTGVGIFDFTYNFVEPTGSGYTATVDNTTPLADKDVYRTAHGSGTLSFGGTEFLLRAKENKDGHFFSLDYGIRGVDGLSGFGWLEYSSDGGETWANGGVSDWLFTADKQGVPEPGMTLGLLAIGGLVASRRKRSSKA